VSGPLGLDEAVAAFVRHPTVLVATDFDGVLAPLVRDPSTSRPLPGTVEDLTGLAGLPRTCAAVVSGRDLRTLTELTGLDGTAVTRIGSHGAESSTTETAAVGPAEQHVLEELVRRLGPVVADHPGSGLEHKPAAVVLHTRGLEGPAAAAAEEAAAEVAAQAEGVHVLRGKHVVEMSVVEADKGSALQALREAVGASAVAYLGDDVTDEHVFERLGADDLGVKVGDGPTAARWRVEGPEAAAALLARLHAARRTAVTGSR
jgi:trehalose 6-phosphate phosphatase